jgi:hypothetical protein
MAITKLNSLAIPANTVVAADLSYPLTSFSSTGIDDNADATAITIDSSENVGIGTTSPSDKLHVYGGASGASAHSYTQLHVEHSSHAAIQLSSPNTSESVIFFSDPQSNSAGGVGYYHAEDFMYLRVNGATRLRVDSDGIKFGSDTNAANALDDYEEGTWTPSATQGGTINTVDAGNCTYTKIGNTVHIRAEFYNFSSTNSSALIIGGLPHAVASGPESTFPVMYYQVNLDSGYTQLTGYVQSNSSNLRFYESGDAVNWSALRGNQCGSSTDFIFSATYQAA